MSSLHENEHAIFVVSNGVGSFKGSGFVRGGIYDRIQIKQEHDIFTFKDADYMNLYSNSASGFPHFKEKAIFIIRGKNFSAAYPWKFIFLANKEDKQTREKSFVSFESIYWLPSEYLKGGRPHIESKEAPWKKIWKNQTLGIIIFCLWIVFVLCFFITRDKWVRLSDRKNKGPVFWPKQISWVFAFLFVGFYKMAQPSITQVLTIFHTPISGWNWELFLIDPYIFIFWLIIILTTFIWGRGLFCGWMCPFGSLSEFIFKIAKKTRLNKFQFLPNSKFHHIFKWLKYIIFFGLVIVSLYSMSLAERLAEVEPFKTTFLVGIWNRSWPYVLFVILILAISILMERPFCKYLCPLGAGLAIPSRFNILKLRRKPGCTTCKACAKGCGALAIDEQGRIDSKECLLCLDCMVMYYDMNSCPPLAKEKKRRQKANLPLTPIDGTGHFIPIYTENQLKK